MLPSDTPFLEVALALLALPFRPTTVGWFIFTSFLGFSLVSACVPCPAHIKYRPQRGRYDEGPSKGPMTVLKAPLGPAVPVVLDASPPLLGA